MDEETDKLINSIHSYSPLWDMRDKRYHSRSIQRKLWAKVAVEMGCDVASAKKKWKGLRDSFRREHKKFLKSGQEAPDEFVSSWPFFEQMLFLSDIMQPRELKGNVSPLAKNTPETDNSHDTQYTEKDYESGTDEGNRSETDEAQVSTAPASVAPVEMEFPRPRDGKESAQKGVEPKKICKKSNEMNCEDSSKKNQGNSHKTDKASAVPVRMGPLPSTPMLGKRKRDEMKMTSKTKASAKAEQYDAEFLKIEKQKLHLFSDSISMKSDSEHQFLISLLPHLKRIPENRQLSVRNKIQQVLIDEEERHSSVQYRSPVPYASPSNVAYPSSHSSRISNQERRLSSDATSQLSWTSQEQPNTFPLSSPWDNQSQQSQSLLTCRAVNNPGQSKPSGSQSHDDLQNLFNNAENSFLTL